MPCSKIPKVLLRNKLFRKDKSEEHTWFISHSTTVNLVVIYRSPLEPPYPSKIPNLGIVKSVHKWFQNKTWVTHTQEHITHTNQPTCAHIFIKQHPKSFPEIGKGITSQTRPLLNASKWNASKALARPASPSSVTGPCACTQSCLTLCNSIGHGPPGSSIHGIFQARILEWDAISFSRASSRPRDWIPVSGTAGRHFTGWVRTLLIYCRIFSLDPYSEQYRSCQEQKFRVRPRFKSSLSLN